MLPATWRSAALVKCALPAHAPGVVTVSVLTNGVEAASGAALFEFVRTVTPRAASPSGGPVHGGTTVVVEADGLDELDEAAAVVCASRRPRRGSARCARQRDRGDVHDAGGGRIRRAPSSACEAVA